MKETVLKLIKLAQDLDDKGQKKYAEKVDQMVEVILEESREEDK